MGRTQVELTLRCHKAIEVTSVSKGLCTETESGVMRLCRGGAEMDRLLVPM